MRICFVAHNAYGALAGVDTGHTGGIERQAALMAQGFARRGHLVSMITWDEGQPDGTRIQGVQMHRMCARAAGIPGLRFFHPKWTSLYRAMRHADADIYYYNCGDLGLGQVVMWCRRHQRKAVYSVASDPDCDARLPVLKPRRERILYRYGLHRVNAIIVQTRHQQQMLREGFRVDSTVIAMPCAGLPASAEGGDALAMLSTAPPRVLWIGRISREKRFEWLLDLAERCPEMTFDVVGAANAGSSYDSRLTARAAQVPNVKMHGRVLHKDIGPFYRRCHALCCTSAYEGFPNTFLEAWSCGIPVVSTFDPDHVIRDQGLGAAAEDLDGMASGLRRLLQSPEGWLACSRAARQHYRDHHAPEVCLPRFEQLFRDVLGQGAVPRPAGMVRP